MSPPPPPPPILNVNISPFILLNSFVKYEVVYRRTSKKPFHLNFFILSLLNKCDFSYKLVTLPFHYNINASLCINTTLLNLVG